MTVKELIDELEKHPSNATWRTQTQGNSEGVVISGIVLTYPSKTEWVFIVPVERRDVSKLGVEDPPGTKRTKAWAERQSRKHLDHLDSEDRDGPIGIESDEYY